MPHLEPLSRCISVEENIACQGDIVGGARLLILHHHVPSSHCHIGKLHCTDAFVM